MRCLFQIPPQIQQAFVAAVDKGNIRTMPNRSMAANPHPTPGALLLGDSFNMRHPLTGGGMTVALSDIVVLQELLSPLRDLNNADSLCKYLESFYTLRKVNICFRQLASAYQILSFYAANMPLPSGCFRVYRRYSDEICCIGFAACGVHNKHIGRCLVQGILCLP